MLIRVKVLQLERWMKKEFNTGISAYEYTKIKPIFNRPGWYLGVFATPIENATCVKFGDLYKISWFEREDGSCYSSRSLLNSFEYGLKYSDDSILTQEEYKCVTGVLGMKGISGTTRKELLTIKEKHLFAYQSRVVCRNTKLFMIKSLKERRKLNGTGS